MLEFTVRAAVRSETGASAVFQVQERAGQLTVSESWSCTLGWNTVGQ